MATNKKADKLSTGWGIASFIFPPIGLGIWAMNQDESPKKAKAAGTLGAVSLGLGLLSMAVRKKGNTGQP